MYEHLNQISIIKDSNQNVSGKFIESSATMNEILKRFDNVDPALLGTLLSKLNEKEKVESLVTFLSENEINAVSAIQKQKSWLKEIENLRRLLVLEEKGKLTLVLAIRLQSKSRADEYTLLNLLYF